MGLISLHYLVFVLVFWRKVIVVLKSLSDNSSIFFSLVLASIVFLQFDLSISWCDDFLLKCVDVFLLNLDLI